MSPLRAQVIEGEPPGGGGIGLDPPEIDPPEGGPTIPEGLPYPDIEVVFRQDVGRTEDVLNDIGAVLSGIRITDDGEGAELFGLELPELDYDERNECLEEATCVEFDTEFVLNELTFEFDEDRNSLEAVADLGISLNGEQIGWHLLDHTWAEDPVYCVFHPWNCPPVFHPGQCVLACGGAYCPWYWAYVNYNEEHVEVSYSYTLAPDPAGFFKFVQFETTYYDVMAGLLDALAGYLSGGERPLEGLGDVLASFVHPRVEIRASSGYTADLGFGFVGTPVTVEPSYEGVGLINYLDVHARVDYALPLPALEGASAEDSTLPTEAGEDEDRRAMSIPAALVDHILYNAHAVGALDNVWIGTTNDVAGLLPSLMPNRPFRALVSVGSPPQVDFEDGDPLLFLPDLHVTLFVGGTEVAAMTIHARVPLEPTLDASNFVSLEARFAGTIYDSFAATRALGLAGESDEVLQFAAAYFVEELLFPDPMQLIRQGFGSPDLESPATAVDSYDCDGGWLNLFLD